MQKPIDNSYVDTPLNTIFLPSFIDDEIKQITIPKNLTIDEEIKYVMQHANITTAIEEIL